MMADIWDIECRAFLDQCRQNATSVVDISISEAEDLLCAIDDADVVQCFLPDSTYMILKGLDRLERIGSGLRTVWLLVVSIRVANTQQVEIIAMAMKVGQVRVDVVVDMLREVQSEPDRQAMH